MDVFLDSVDLASEHWIQQGFHAVVVCGGDMHHASALEQAVALTQESFDKAH